MSSVRVLSYSEISTALDCQARWDFRYGDHLAGSSLREKTIVPILSGGRAWGAAVAAWHTNVGRIDAGELAIKAMDESLEADADQQREHGVHDQEAHDELRVRLLKQLTHYMGSADPVKMDEVVERQLLVPIPSRKGVRMSSRYKLLCYLDATETDDDGDVWLDEFKLRGQLTDVKLITLSRQIRWYAWAWWQQTGVKPVGVWVNERLNEAPKPPRMTAGGKLSHAKEQKCTVGAYKAACNEHGEEPNPDTVEYLRARRWQQRVPVIFRETELEEAGQELVTAARLVHMLEGKDWTPLRNAKRANCNWCPFRDICPSPDNDLVEALFLRRPPKRDRDPDELLSRS